MAKDYSGSRRQRNKKWRGAYIGHGLQGGIIGLLVPPPINLIIACVVFCIYEIVEYIRLRDLRDAEHAGKPIVGDWLSLDFMDFLTGIWGGIAVQILSIIALVLALWKFTDII